MAQSRNINVIPNSAITRVHVSQGDIGRTIYFNLYEGSLAYTPTSGDIITCVGTKPSGLGFTVNCTWSGNVVTCVTTEEMTDESGSIDAELVITSSDETTVLGTSNFRLCVEANPHPETTTDGNMETLIPELTLLVNEVEGYAEEIEGTYHAYGSPWVASTVAEMTDTDKIYVYTGSESGYTNGNWYYYNGTAWVSGGVYNSVAVNIDDTLTVQGACADAKAVGDEISDVKTDLNIITDKTFDQTNLYNYHYVIDGYNIQSGVITSNANWSYLNIKINVSDEETISIRNFSEKYGECSCSFYNASGVFISRLGITALKSSNNYSVAYTVPENSAYCMFAISLNTSLSKTDNLMISYGDVPEKYYYEDQINSEWLWQDERLQTLELQNSLIFDISQFDNLLLEEFRQDGYQISSTGAVTANNDYALFDYYLPVSDNSNVYMKIYESGVYGFVAFYDSDKIFISRSALDNSSNFTATIPDGCVYVRFTLYKTVSDKAFVSFENEFPTHHRYGHLVIKQTSVPEVALEKGSSLRFCLIGDLHCGECGGFYNPSDPSEEGTTWDSQGTYAGATLDERMQLLVDTINAENAKKPFDFILSTGDIGLEYGTSTQAEFNNPAYLEKFCEEYMPQLPCPLYAAPGNHDCFTEEDWQNCIGLPRQYSFETDDFYFIILDVFSNITMGCNGASSTGIGYDHIDFDYLEAEYAKARNKKVIIVAHAISNNTSSELGYEDQVKMQAFVQSHSNVILTITGHSHKYVFKTWWGIPTINSNHFCYPVKQWSAGYNEHSYLWSINVVEINSDGTALQTYYVQPAHNYTGMGLDYPYTVGTVHDIIAIDKNYHADFYAHKADKRNIELSKQIYDLMNRVSALEDET